MLLVFSVIVYLLIEEKTGLFSATVAGFIIESYKGLQCDSGETAVLLLLQISRQLVDGTNFSEPFSSGLDTDFSPFTPPTSSIIVNCLWFTSLILSLACALSATLMQKWARHYLRASY